MSAPSIPPSSRSQTNATFSGKEIGRDYSFRRSYTFHGCGKQMIPFVLSATLLGGMAGYAAKGVFAQGLRVTAGSALGGLASVVALTYFNSKRQD